MHPSHIVWRVPHQNEDVARVATAEYKLRERKNAIPERRLHSERMSGNKMRRRWQDRSSEMEFARPRQSRRYFLVLCHGRTMHTHTECKQSHASARFASFMMRSSAGVGPSIRVSTNEINIDVTSSHVDTSNDIAFATLQSPCRNFIFALRPNIIRVNNNN